MKNAAVNPQRLILLVKLRSVSEIPIAPRFSANWAYITPFRFSPPLGGALPFPQIRPLPGCLSTMLQRKRRVVVAFRQRKGRTLLFVVRTEPEGVELAMQHVSRMAVMHADEASHWDRLHEGWQVGRINHSEAYATLESCTNQVESYFSRLRRMIRGQHHHVSARHLHQYSNHAAWLEDHRELPNGELAGRVGDLALGHPVSGAWKGYWQGAK